VTVHDREPGRDSRNQGGTLDLRTDDGQLALREAGLIDEFFRLARPEGQEMRQMDPAGRMLLHTVPAAGDLFLEAWFDEVETRHPEIAELVGAGSAAAADGDRGLFAQRNSGDHIRVYIIRRVPLGRRVDETDLLDEFAHWSPRLRRLITDHEGPLVERPLFALPVPHLWETVPTVTLLGDAAHLMPPLGIGVNLAMLDACELAVAIAESPTIEDAVRAYEKTMLPRSAEMARLTEGGGEFLLSGELPGVGD
jgi:FAD binding domain-containing protein